MGIFLMSQDKIASSSIRLRAAAEVTQCLPFNNSHVWLEQTDDRDRTDSCDGETELQLKDSQCWCAAASVCRSLLSLMTSEVLIRVWNSSEALAEVDVLTRHTRLHEYTTWTKEQHAALIFMLIKNREQIVLCIMQHASGRRSCTTGNQLGLNPTVLVCFCSVSSSVWAGRSPSGSELKSQW